MCALGLIVVLRVEMCDVTRTYDVAWCKETPMTSSDHLSSSFLNSSTFKSLLSWLSKSENKQTWFEEWVQGTLMGNPHMSHVWGSL